MNTLQSGPENTPSRPGTASTVVATATPLPNELELSVSSALTEIAPPYLDPSTLNFESGLKVVNRTNRFVIPVPTLGDGGEPLVYPPGTEKAGQPLKTREDGSPDRGIVFYNGKDSAWQSARGDGKETILVNDITPADAARLSEKLSELGGQAITLEGLGKLLDFARNELGAVDFYHKKMADVLKEMAPADPAQPLYVTVTKPTIHSAVFVREPFRFDGPVVQTYYHGAVVLDDGKRSWGIDADVFLRNFKAVGDGMERPLTKLEAEFPTAEFDSYVRQGVASLDALVEGGDLSLSIFNYSEDETRISAYEKAAEIFNLRESEHYVEVSEEQIDRPVRAQIMTVKLRHPIQAALREIGSRIADGMTFRFP